MIGGFFLLSAAMGFKFQRIIFNLIIFSSDQYYLMPDAHRNIVID